MFPRVEDLRPWEPVTLRHGSIPSGGDAASVEMKRRFQLGEERPKLPDRIVADRRLPWAYGFGPVGTSGLSPLRARGSREDLSYIFLGG
jgi:hypothetical protein